DEEIRGVRVLHDALLKRPSSYALLHVQVDFLRSKGKFDIACQLAKRAVNCAPSEFVTWAKLTEIYIDIGDFKSALLTMNSCPMFTFTERDMPRAPAPARVHALIRSESLMGKDDEDNDQDLISDTSPRLQATQLRGTFSRVYGMLAQLAFKIGWEELLRCRSGAFVMEEEYRMVKRDEEDTVETGMVPPEGEEEKQTPIAKVPTPDAATTTTANTEAATTEAVCEEEKSAKEEKEEEKKEATPENGQTEEASQATSPPVSNIMRPKGTAEGPIPDGDSDASNEDDTSDANQFSVNGKNSRQFNAKRLCERWLDNLFMVLCALLQDLRAYTVWQAEMAHHRAQGIPYLRSAADWEALGDLALRLHHKASEAAKEAYIRGVRSKFSVGAWTHLLDLYTENGEALKALDAAVQLAIFHDSQYNEVSYPMPITHTLNRLVRAHGLSKVKNMLISMNLSMSVQLLMTRYLGYIKAFQVEGWDL
ncbi:Chs5p-Arf1p-binding proteins-domain-containing protein, partial [Thamnocephalis sphaerospora]